MRRPEWGWPAVGGIALVTIAALVSVLLLISRPDPVLRGPNLCPQAGPSRVTAILVDTTDRVGPISRTDILERLDDVVSSSRTDEMMIAYETSVIGTDGPGQGNPLLPLLAVCNPGDPDEASEWTQNPRLVRRQFEEDFRQPLERTFAELVNLRQPAERSPLMENVQAISVTVLARREYAGIPKQLILISDLMQHSDYLSLYNHQLDYEAFDRTAGADAVRTNLRDVAVDILFVQRRDHRRFDSARRLLRFWERWIDGQGGRLERVSRIDGLN